MVRDFSQSSLLKKEVYYNSQEKVKSIIKEEIATEEDAKNQSSENYMKQIESYNDNSMKYNLAGQI